MKKVNFISLKQKLGFIVGIGIAITALMLITYASIESRSKSIEAARNNANYMAKEFAKDISLELETAITSSRAIANGLSAVGNNMSPLRITREDAIKIGEKVLFSNPNFLGFTLAFEPNAFDGADKKYKNTSAHDATGRF